MYESFRKNNKHKNYTQSSSKNLQIYKYLTQLKKETIKQKEIEKDQHLQHPIKPSRQEPVQNNKEKEFHQQLLKVKQEKVKSKDQARKIKIEENVESNTTKNLTNLNKNSEDHLLEQIKTYKKQINSHPYKPNTKQSRKLMSNSNKIYPLSIKIFISKLDLLTCGGLQKTIKIVKEEQDLMNGSLLLFENGAVFIHWNLNASNVLKVKFTDLIDVCSHEQYFMMKYKENHVEKSCLVEICEKVQKADSWSKYLKAICQYEKLKKKQGRNQKWLKLGINSSMSSMNIPDYEVISSIPELKEEKKEIRKIEISPLSSSRVHYSKSQKVFKSPKNLKNSLVNKISPRLKQSESKITLNQQQKKINVKKQYQQSSKQSQILPKAVFSEKIKGKIEEKKKLIQMAKETSLDTENYWAEAERQFQERRLTIIRPISKKRQTQYMDTHEEIEIRRKVNTNDETMTVKERKKNLIREKNRQRKSSFISIFGKSSDGSKSHNKSKQSKYNDSESTNKKQEKFFLQKLKFQESRKLSKNMQEKEIKDEEIEDEIQSSEDNSKNEDEISLQTQELKNGIILRKCSPSGWSSHEKKLYLSENQFQLCYCDIKYRNDEKKIFVEDITQIQYKQYGKGIIKHIKNVDPNRCMTITYKQGNQKKAIQFVLSQDEPIENLESFHRKLEAFLKRNQEKYN